MNRNVGEHAVVDCFNCVDEGVSAAVYVHSKATVAQSSNQVEQWLSRQARRYPRPMRKRGEDMRLTQ